MDAVSAYINCSAPCTTPPSITECEAQVNGTWSVLSTCTVNVQAGQSLTLSVNPNSFTNYTQTWTGPNSFTATGNDENRFSIKFDAPMITGVETMENDVKFYESSGQIIIEADGISGNSATFSMYNSAGQSIIPDQTIQLNGGRSSVNSPEVAAGIYIVKLQKGNTEYTERIYIRKAPIF